MKHIGLVVALVLLLTVLLPFGVVVADSITNAVFYAVITTSNTGTAATLVTSVVTGATTPALVSGGFCNATATDLTVRNTSGAAIPFMPGLGTNLMCIYNGSLGANTITDYLLYSKGVTGGLISYFPGATGGTIPDTLAEPAAAFEWDFTNCLLTPSSSAGVEDDFEEGLDGASLATLTNPTWTVSVAGTSKAEIDTAQYYTGYGGTRSARLYRDGTNNSQATCSQTALDSTQSITCMVRKDDNAEGQVCQGNGTKLMIVDFNTDETVRYYDGSYTATGASIAISTWYKLTIKNVNWTAGTFDIYLNDTIIKSGATMLASTSFSNQLRIINLSGTSEFWMDNIQVTYTDTDRVLMSHYNAQSGGYKLIESPVTGGKYLGQVWTPTAANTAEIRPNAAGATTALSKTGATNWGSVSDSSDASYVFTNSAAYLTDTYAHVSLPYMVGSINSVTIYFKLYGTGGAIFATPVWRIGGTDYAGTEQAGDNVAFAEKTQTYNTSPATGIAWTWAEVQAAEFGIKLKNNGGGNTTQCSEVWIVVNYNNFTITQADVSGITAGEYDIVYSLSGGTLTLTIGGTSGTTSVATVPNSTAVTTLLQGTAVAYIESFTYTQGGAKVDLWDWEYAATFTGDTTHNVFTPTFRTTSSDADVTSSLGSLQSMTVPTAPAFAVGGGPDFISNNITASETPNPVSGNNVLTYPGKSLIDAVATAGGVPYQIPSTYIGTFVLLVMSWLTSFFLKEQSANSIFAKSIVNTVGYGVLVALNIFDWWMLIFFFIFEQAIWFGGKERRE